MVLKTTAILDVVVLLLGVVGTGDVKVLLDIVGVGVVGSFLSMVASWVSVEAFLDALPIDFMTRAFQIAESLLPMVVAARTSVDVFLLDALPIQSMT